MDEYDGLDDGELAAALRDRADALTVDVLDTDAAFGAVTQRARARRFRRSAATGALAAAAAVVGVLLVTSVDRRRAGGAHPGHVADRPGHGDDRTPGTAADPRRHDDRVDDGPAGGPDHRRHRTRRWPPPPPRRAHRRPSRRRRRRHRPQRRRPARSTTFDSSGGSITVRLAGGAIALAGDPSPSAGYSVRIDDNGPDRVRVRFESDAGRSEIRVDLRGRPPRPRDHRGLIGLGRDPTGRGPAACLHRTETPTPGGPPCAPLATVPSPPPSWSAPQRSPVSASPPPAPSTPRRRSPRGVDDGSSTSGPSSTGDHITVAPTVATSSPTTVADGRPRRPVTAPSVTAPSVTAPSVDRAVRDRAVRDRVRR